MKHEEIGIKYLIEKLGYSKEDITVNIRKGIYDKNKGLPDLTTSDNKKWEVKVLQGLSRVSFTQFQLDFDDDVNILIFRKFNNEYEFLNCIKFGDIRNQKEMYGYISNTDKLKHYT